MATVLEYDFAVVGRRNIERELASLERRFVQHGARVDRAMGGNGRVGGGGSGQRSAAASAASAERATLRAARERQRQIDAVQRSQASLNRQRIREEREISSLQTRAARDRQRAIDKQVRSQQSLARQRAREEKSALKALTEQSESRSRFVRSTIGGGASRVMGGLSAVGRTGAAMVGIGGAALAATSIAQAVKLDEMTRRLSIAGRGKGQKGVDPEAMRRQFTQTGIATGFAPEAIAGGAAAFVQKTGDLDTALKNQGVFATVAQGAGAQVEEVFSAAADLSTKLDISSVEKMSEAFAILSAQGKKGAFELKAMAGEFPEVLASAATAGVKGIGGVRDVGAIMQIARSASGSDSEASTAVQAMFRQLAAKATDIQSGKAFGGKGKAQVFEGGDAKKPMRNFVDVVTDVISASGGDITQLQDVFDIRGIKAVNPMIAAFREASTAAGGGKAGDKAGRAKVREMFGEFQNVSGDFSELQRDAADAMKSFSVQTEIVNTKLKVAIATQLMPELEKLIPELTALVPQVAKLTKGLIGLVKWVTENPLAGIGAALALAITFEMAKARLGAILAGGLKSLFAAASTGGIRGVAGAVTPTMGGPSNKLGAGMTGLAVGATVAASIYSGGIAKFEAGEDSMNVGGQSLNAVRAAAGAGDVETIKAAIAEQRKRLNASKKTDLLDDTLDIFGASNKKAEAATQQSFLDEMLAKLGEAELKAAADQQKAAAEALTAAAVQLGGAGPNRGDKPTGIK